MMTENLLQKLEEKMMTLVSEMEDARKEIQRLAHENAALKSEKEINIKKVQELIALLDAVIPADNAAANMNFQAIKPVLVQA